MKVFMVWTGREKTTITKLARVFYASDTRNLAHSVQHTDDTPPAWLSSAGCSAVCCCRSALDMVRCASVREQHAVRVTKELGVSKKTQQLDSS